MAGGLRADCSICQVQASKENCTEEVAWNRLRDMCQSCWPEYVKRAHTYVRPFHTVQASGLNQGDESWEHIEIEQTEGGEPASSHDPFERALLFKTFNDDEEAATAAIVAFRGPVIMTIGHHDCPIDYDVHESEDVSNRVEQTEVEATARIRALLGRRHEAEQHRLPASVIGVDVRPVHVGDGPRLHHGRQPGLT